MYEPKTFEELLMGQINKALEAMSAENSKFFDGVIESIEILLKIVPPMYNDYMKQKEILYKEALENIRETEREVEKYDDAIFKEYTKSTQESVISWTYRKDIFDAIVSILSKYNKIAYTNQEFAAFNQAQTVQQVQPVQPVQQVQQVQPVQQQPAPQQQYVPHAQQYQQQQAPVQQQESKISDEELRQLLMNREAKQKQEKQPAGKFNGLLFGRK